jgi:hypothetical protein
MGTLIGFGLLGVYGYCGWKFWNGFDRTHFSQSFSNRLVLSALWPFLLYSKSYRRNFTKALKGQ